MCVRQATTYGRFASFVVAERLMAQREYDAVPNLHDPVCKDHPALRLACVRLRCRPRLILWMILGFHHAHKVRGRAKGLQIHLFRPLVANNTGTVANCSQLLDNPLRLASTEV
jgi:hypothetical protein